MLPSKPTIWTFVLISAGLLQSQMAKAENHSYINKARSSSATTYYLQADYAAENSRFEAIGNYIDDGSEFTQSQNWKGYTFRTSVGGELWNLIQLSLGHRLIEKSPQADELETLDGWGLDATAKLVFKSPIVNVELGTGIMGSRLDYRYGESFADFHGSGLFNSLDLNYYLSRSLSFYGHIRQEQEHLVRTSGNASVKSFDTRTTHMGIGIRLWLQRSLASSLRLAM